MDRVKDVKQLQVGNVGSVCHSCTAGLRENVILQPLRKSSSLPGEDLVTTIFQSSWEGAREQIRCPRSFLSLWSLGSAPPTGQAQLEARAHGLCNYSLRSASGLGHQGESQEITQLVGGPTWAHRGSSPLLHGTVFLGLGERNRTANMAAGRPNGFETRESKFWSNVAVAVRTGKRERVWNSGGRTDRTVDLSFLLMSSETDRAARFPAWELCDSSLPWLWCIFICCN